MGRSDARYEFASRPVAPGSGLGKAQARSTRWSSCLIERRGGLSEERRGVHPETKIFLTTTITGTFSKCTGDGLVAPRIFQLVAPIGDVTSCTPSLCAASSKLRVW